jgi:hypothetical protein
MIDLRPAAFVREREDMYEVYDNPPSELRVSRPYSLEERVLRNYSRDIGRVPLCRYHHVWWSCAKQRSAARLNLGETSVDDDLYYDHHHH